jgi:hypothetical protein
VNTTRLHPVTGAPITPLGYRKDGRAIWPVLGGDGTDPAQPPAQPTPAQPPAPAPPPAPPVPVPGPPPSAPPAQLPPTPPAPAPADGDTGFPANTPWREMTKDQQVAYWIHQSRRHEARVSSQADYDELKSKAAELEQLRTSTQTDHQRAIAEARQAGAQEALATANTSIVEQWVRAAAHGRLANEGVDALLAGLNRSAFVTNGVVDTDKVWQFVSSLAPAPAAVPAAPAAPTAPVGGVPAPVPAPVQPQPQPLAQGPDFGQGQSTAPLAPAIDRGREIAKRRYAQQQTPKPTVLQ